MNELHFAYKIRQSLNRGSYDLRPEVLERLATARQAALASQKQAAGYPLLASTGHPSSLNIGRPRPRQFFAALALFCCAIFSIYWIADLQVQELGDIDSAILSDELPIGAFTDKGFAIWLNDSSVL